jgi:hypothetical protein
MMEDTSIKISINCCFGKEIFRDTSNVSKFGNMFLNRWKHSDSQEKLFVAQDGKHVNFSLLKQTIIITS